MNNHQIVNSTNSITKKKYINIINHIISEIKNNSLEKVVLSRSEELKYSGNLDYPLIIQKMRNNYPKCINFSINLPDRGKFFGSTPERLISKKGYTIISEAIAGTIQRDDNPINDEQLAHQLKNDSKSLHEHKLVIDQIRQVLETNTSNIKISNSRHILKLKNL